MRYFFLLVVVILPARSYCLDSPATIDDSDASDGVNVALTITDVQPLNKQPKADRLMSVQELIDAGDSAGALEEAREMLPVHANTRQLSAFVMLGRRLEFPAIQDQKFKARTSELLAEIRGDAGRPRGPRAAIRRGNGPRPAAHLLLDAARKYVIGDFPAARALLDRRLQENSRDEPALRLRTFTLRNMKLYAASAADARAALALSPRDFRARRALISDAMDLGRPQEALEEANRALLEAPDPQLFAARAYVWGRMGDNGKKIEDLKRAATLDAEFDQPYEQAVLSGAAPGSRRPRTVVAWLGAVVAALLFFCMAFRKLVDSSRPKMSESDPDFFSRGAGAPERRQGPLDR